MFTWQDQLCQAFILGSGTHLRDDPMAVHNLLNRHDSKSHIHVQQYRVPSEQYISPGAASTPQSSELVGKYSHAVASVCAHGHRSGRCRQCGTGASFCAHGRRRWECRDCGGASICPHGRRRARCRECGGVSICSHGRVKWTCRSCGSHCFCEHGRQRYKCKDCSAARGSGSCKAGQTARRARTSLTQGQPLPSSPPLPPLPPSLPLPLPSPPAPETPLLQRLPSMTPCFPSPQTAARACSPTHHARLPAIAVLSSHSALDLAAEQPLSAAEHLARAAGSAFSVWSGRRKCARGAPAAAARRPSSPLAGAWSEQAAADGAAAGAARCDGVATTMGGWSPPLLPDIRVGAGAGRMEQREFRLV
jgi:hypothetical protein